MFSKFRKKSIDSSALHAVENQGATTPSFMPQDSNSDRVLSSATSNTLARLLTISEKKSPTLVDLPVLPPLSEARSVKEKWNILLSKAKGKS